MAPEQTTKSATLTAQNIDGIDGAESDIEQAESTIERLGDRRDEFQS